MASFSDVRTQLDIEHRVIFGNLIPALKTARCPDHDGSKSEPSVATSASLSDRGSAPSRKLPQLKRKKYLI